MEFGSENAHCLVFFKTHSTVKMTYNFGREMANDWEDEDGVSKRSCEESGSIIKRNKKPSANI